MNNERDELMLDSMGPSAKGGFEIKTLAGGPETAKTLLFIADSMRSALDAHDAPNYLEMEVKASDGKRYIMTLQRAGKITPHQARVKAEEALEASKPRTITTAEELDALPVGSVVRMSGTSEDARVAVKDGVWKGESEWFVADADEWCLDSTELDDLPATVLYEPEPQP